MQKAMVPPSYKAMPPHPVPSYQQCPSGRPAASVTTSFLKWDGGSAGACIGNQLLSARKPAYTLKSLFAWSPIFTTVSGETSEATPGRVSVRGAVKFFMKSHIWHTWFNGPISFWNLFKWIFSLWKISATLLRVLDLLSLGRDHSIFQSRTEYKHLAFRHILESFVGRRANWC